MIFDFQVFTGWVCPLKPLPNRLSEARQSRHMTLRRLHVPVVMTNSGKINNSVSRQMEDVALAMQKAVDLCFHAARPAGSPIRKWIETLIIREGYLR